ncbi:MAG: SDR family NAD(P)-dependent oxidoreductase [Phycisphaerae bacterium]
MPGDSESTRQCPIAIIGMDCLFPNAEGLHEYWRLIRHCEDGVSEVPESHWKISDYFAEDPGNADMLNCKRGAFLSPTAFDPLEFGIPPTIIEATDTAQLLGLVVAKRALSEAGYDDRRGFDRRRASVILGVTGMQELVLPLGARLGHPIWRDALREAGLAPDVAEDVVRRIAKAYVQWQENSFPGLLGNVVAGRIANRLDLRGTNCVVDAACASSLSAVHLAALELSSGRTDLVLSGGVDTLNDIFMFMCFSKAQALSPTGDARPFSKDADGTVIGEGVGMLVLKRLGDAERDNDRVYAVLRGIGTSSDGRSQSIYAPHAVGQARALRAAYEISAVDPVTIELVEAHGTGTKVGDAVELEALTTVYREAKRERKWCALGSVKSQIGHTKAAAGAASMIKAVLALHHRVLPATIKISEPNPKLGLADSPFYLSTETRPWFSNHDYPRRAAVSSFGFGGSNFHAVLEEHPDTNREVTWDGSVEIVALSAPDPAHLETRLDEWAAAAAKGFARNELANRAARSREKFSAKDGYRLVLVVERQVDLTTLVTTAKAALKQKGTEKAWQLPNVFFGGPGEAGKLAFLFPGQGSQYGSMGRDLVCQFPEAFDAVAEADAADGNGECLADRIYPQPTFSAQVRRDQEDELKRTEITQPALGAVSLAMLRVLKRFGIKPDFAAGHSFGELVALRAAGRIGDEALRQLARLRGCLMGAAKGGHGAMLAVDAPLEEIDDLLQAESDDVVLANRNTPVQGIISGLRKAVEKVGQACQQRGWRTKMLEVSAAFHTKFMVPAQERFRAALEEISFELGRIPVFANVTAALYPADAGAARDLLARQLTSPVNFVDQIKNLYDAGARTFIEVGPKNVLTGLVRNILHGNRLYALALDASRGRGNGVVDLARVLALLTVLGYNVDLQAWERPAPEVVHPNMALSLLGCNYRSPAKPAPDIHKHAGPVAKEEVENTSMNIFENGDAPQVPAATPTSVDCSTSAARAARPSQPDAAHADQLAQGFQVVQEGLRAMQTLQQQTAAAHQRFLQTQEQAHKTIELLIQNQQRLLAGALGLPGPSPPSPASAAPTGSGGDSKARTVEAALLRIVSEKTGYPLESVHLDMHLDDDLGIDEVRRVEILSALQNQLPSSNRLPARRAIQPKTLREIVELALAGTASEPSLAPSADGSATGESGDVETAGGTSDGAAGEFERIVLEPGFELTGYPVEMLDLDMDMEADLGIDSIKRLEIFGAVQRRVPGMEAVNAQYMGSLRTLRNIIEYAHGAGAASAVLATPSESTPEPAQPTAPPPADTLPAAKLERRILTTVELAPAKQHPLRIAAGYEVWVTDDGTPLAPTLVKRLVSLGHAARVIGRRTDTEDASKRKAGGLILLAPPTEIDAAQWDEDTEEDLKAAFARVKRLGPNLRDAAASGGALLATISRLGGAFGLRGGAFNPLHGGLSGLAKTAAHEWPEVHCRALDVSPAWQDVDAIADAIVRELGADGPIEVGLDTDSRVGLQTISSSATPGSLPLEDRDVVVISGGARGVTAEAALALTQSKRPTLVLVGRSPAPTSEPDWLARHEGEAEIKRALLAHAFDRAKQPAPVELEAEYRRRMANREVARNLDRLRSSGSTVVYRAVDVRDRAAVAELLDEVRREYGPVRGLIHGAGVIEDRRIEDKTPEQFARVFDTKVVGLRALLDAVRDDDLKFMVFFSSVSGRFGRAGQVDYAIANEVLNKVAHQQAALRPECRVVSINWGPWDGGMITPALKHEFTRLGIKLMPLDAGARCMVDELCTRDRDAVEVLIGGSLPEPMLPPSPSGPQPQQVVAGNGRMAIAFERELDVESHPFLCSHVLDGHPVLPVAMILEWLGHGALHDNPGLVLHGFDDFRVLKGVILDKGPKAIRVLASRAKRDGDTFEVYAELRSGRASEQEFTHARAKVLLTTRFPESPAFEMPANLRERPYTPDIDAVYRDILFHGPHFRGIKRVAGISERGMVAEVRSAPAPEAWMTEPLRTSWLGDPLVVDAGLQLGVLWCHEELGAVALPSRGARCRQYQPFPPEGVTTVLEVHQTGPQWMAADLTFLDATGQVIARMERHEWTVDASLRAAFDRNAAVGA